MPERPAHSTLRTRTILWIWRRLPVSGRAKHFIAWLGNIRYAVGVAAIVLNDQDEVLVLRHTYRRRGYEWGIPGGWAKGRESVEQALAREILEETGFTVSVERLVTVQSGYALPRISIIFMARLTGGEFRSSDEVSDYTFCRPDRLPRILPAERLAVTRALIGRLI